MTTTTTPTDSRVGEIFADVHAALLEIIVKHRVTMAEFRVATAWLTEAGNQDHEIPLLLDVFLSPTVDDLAHRDSQGTECNIEGPFYVEGAPLLEFPYVLPKRADEPGQRLLFSGVVRSTDGCPLAGATLDIWQANGAGEYSHFQPGVPEHNLRGRLTTDDAGRFEVETVVPSGYAIPLAGATGRLLAALGREGIRPGHLHVKLSHPDAVPLTTQIYFDHDPMINSDVVNAVKPSLVTTLTTDDDGHATCWYDFVLPTI